MDIIITIQHPAHVHFFKNPIRVLREQGHSVYVLVRESEIIVDLLEEFNIDHDILATGGGSITEIVKNQLSYEYRILKNAKKIKPDVMLAIGEPAVAHVSKVINSKSFLFLDSEPSNVHKLFTTPFADRIFTPESYQYDYGDKHVRYPGYHELSYLHPDRFEPDPDALRDYEIEPEEDYSVVRFISWGAHHDVNQSGFSDEAKEELVSILDEYSDVFITIEGEIPEVFKQYQQPIPPQLMHNLLYHANLYIGDSQTMATEAAVLGTPAIRSNSFAGEGDFSNFQELEQDYGLLRSTPDETEALRLAEDWIKKDEHNEAWNRRQEELLDDKIDVTSFVVQLIEEENSI